LGSTGAKHELRRDFKHRKLTGVSGRDRKKGKGLRRSVLHHALAVMP